jgi:hypothetical protein
MLSYSGYRVYQDMAQLIGSEAVKEGSGEPEKTLKAIRSLLEKLGVM